MSKGQRMTKGSTALVAAALSLALLPAAGAQGAPAPVPAVAVAALAPPRGALFGAHANLRNGQSQYESIVAFERSIGRRLDVTNKFHGWSNHVYKDEAAHLKAGRVPLISWRATDDRPDPNRADRISAGTYDATIVATADAIKALGGPVLLRWNWEMDQEPGERQYIGGPASFIRAWRHIHTVFQRRGATNAKFVWAPRANSFNKGRGQLFYPGPQYVDWIGGSTVPRHSWRDFSVIYAGFYKWGAAQGKPLLAWAGVREKPGDPGWKQRWIDGAHTTIERDMPALKALVYYHALSPLGYRYWADTSPRALAAFKAMGCDPYFDAGGQC